MEKKLVLTLEQAKKFYPTSDSTMKAVFESTFGKNSFKTIDNIEKFEDVLDLLGETEDIPHKHLNLSVWEKSDNAIWRLRRICKLYNLSLKQTVDRNNSSQYRYFPYSVLNGVSRRLFVFCWSYCVHAPAGLDFLSKEHCEKCIVLFKPIFDDYFGVK